MAPRKLKALLNLPSHSASGSFAVEGWDKDNEDRQRLAERRRRFEERWKDPEWTDFWPDRRERREREGRELDEELRRDRERDSNRLGDRLNDTWLQLRAGFRFWDGFGLLDAWTCELDNPFALRLFEEVDLLETVPQPPGFPQLCQRCRNIRILSDDFELIFEPSELQKAAAESCELCRMFHQFVKPANKAMESPSGSTGRDRCWKSMAMIGPSLGYALIWALEKLLTVSKSGFRCCPKRGAGFTSSCYESGFGSVTKNTDATPGPRVPPNLKAHSQQGSSMLEMART